MSLVSRLSGFFLATLAAVLLGFSLTLYGLASYHLQRQLEERLNAALATLAAAVEVGPAGVEWEPGERDLALGRDTGADQIRWIVHDDRGQLLDRSANLDSRRLLPAPPHGFVDGRIRDWKGRTWLSKTRMVTVLGPITLAGHYGASTPPAASDDARPGAVHAGLALIAFAPLAPTETTLRWLLLTLALLSTTLWLVFAVTGRRLCRRALAPLTRMAVAARDSDAADPRTRLPLPGSKDELEDLGTAFNGLLDRLHEALERQRRFTGDASHQLRTPLTGLLSQVDVALRLERPPGEYQRVLKVVRAKGAQLKQIIESLLFLARAESESARPELIVIDLTNWVPEHLRSWSTHERADDLEVAQDDEEPLWVHAHPALLSQLLDNLLENACKYSRPGKPVVVQTRRDSGFALLAVVDQGYGLSADEQARVFQPFYRCPQPRSRGQTGVGLGLAVAERIVAAFGGTIRVDSKPGVGSRFEISLPETTCDRVRAESLSREPRS